MRHTVLVITKDVSLTLIYVQFIRGDVFQMLKFPVKTSLSLFFRSISRPVFQVKIFQNYVSLISKFLDNKLWIRISLKFIGRRAQLLVQETSLSSNFEHTQSFKVLQLVTRTILVSQWWMVHSFRRAANMLISELSLADSRRRLSLLDRGDEEMKK